MGSPATATSILEFLTHPNPTVSQDKTDYKSNTSSKRYLTPQRLKKWHEFDDLECLRTIFDGTLLQEARRKGRNLPHYPTVFPETDLDVEEEPATVSMINKWTRSMVTSALQPVKHIFNPVIWKPGKGKVATKVFPEPPRAGVRKQLARANSKKTRKQDKISISRLRPDSGSHSPGCDLEKFLKEYKSASAWTSQAFFAREPIDDEGKWINNSENKQWAMPIRQAYSYCVKHMCRYGCILSCNEAFIFRIRPINRFGGPSEPDDLLLNSVSRNGIMEYASIPWSNHSSEAEEFDDKWTVNLVLWFLHILAGNNHEIDWEYSLLGAQKLSGQVSEQKEEGQSTEQEGKTADSHALSSDDGVSEEDEGERYNQIEKERGIFRLERKRKRGGQAEEEDADDDDEDDGDDDDDDEQDDLPHHSFAQRSFSVG